VTEKTAVAEKVTYKFGSETTPAWGALDQKFKTLVLSNQMRREGEFVTVTSQRLGPSFVDLITGEVVPWVSVAYAVPA
jgi:hypothetical protein